MNYYTNPTATITAGNTPNSPTTLGDACSRAESGDTIYLSAGTYRGTYTPQSGVSLMGVGNPTISGLDVVAGPYTKVGDYYRVAATTLPPLAGSMGADQVFIDGAEVMESRWPLATTTSRGDISSWAECTAVSVSTNGPNYEATYAVPGLPGGALTDCRAHVLNGYQWISVGGQVIASTATTVTVRFPNDGYQSNVPTPGSRLYLWGGATLPHGFHISGGYLYLAGDPTGKVVEIKTRHWGLDLCSVLGVTVKGIRFHCCSIYTDASTRRITLDSLSMQNITHFQAPTHYWWGPPCISLRDGSRMLSSTVTSAAGGVLELRGDGCTVDNTTITDVTYSGCCQPGISLQGSKHAVSRSTIGMAGSSSLLDMRQASGCTFKGCEVYGGGGILTDGGTVMFADSHITADQGNLVRECYIHDTRGRTNRPNLYGNAGIYMEAGASVTVRDCHIRGASSNDLQAVPLDGTPAYILVERCTLGSLNLSYSGTATKIPITYRDNIVSRLRGNLTPATITGNAVESMRLAGNTQASGVLGTLDTGGYPGPYSPPNCGAKCGATYYWGAYSTALTYTATVIRATKDIKVRLEGPPPPDGFSVRCGALEAVVKQYSGYLLAEFLPMDAGPADVLLSAPGCIPRTLRVQVPPPALSLNPSSGTTITGAGLKTTTTSLLVTISSNEESWDVPVPVPVGAYISQGLMALDGSGIETLEGLALYVDPTYPGGVHAWVRVPRIPKGSSSFTLVLGGTNNVSSASKTFMDAAFHLGTSWDKEECEGITVRVDNTDLSIQGTTTLASKFGTAGIRAKADYTYPNRPFSWDSYISMAPNTANYWWAGLGNNSFLLTEGGSKVSGNVNVPSTLGRQFSRRLVSNIQLPNSALWMEDMVVVNTRDGLPNAKGMFTIMVSNEGKAVEWRYHYIRARGVPDSGAMPAINATAPIPPTLRLWVGGHDCSSLVGTYTDTTITLMSAPPLAPGTYDLRVVVGGVGEYTLAGGYKVQAPPPPTPSATKKGKLVPNPTTRREVGLGPLSSCPQPTRGQVYISYEGTCYACPMDTWQPYQVVDVANKGEASPITGSWPPGTLLAKVGDGVRPANLLPLSGGELPLSEYGGLYSALTALGYSLPTTDGAGVEGTTHFLLPNHSRGVVSIPGGMVVGFGGWVRYQGGKDYSLEWLVAV